MKKKKNIAILTVKEIALMGMMVAIIESCKIALSFLPNVETTTFWLILFTLFFGWRIVFVVPVFILLEVSMYGPHLWVIMYAYIWPLLALLTYLLRKQESVWVFCVLAGGFGLCFGALCSIPYFFIGGAKTAFAWWVAGIPYDLIHCVSNFLLCRVLFLPLKNVAKNVCKRD